jgi:ABC-type multidrug transport system permease subunit
MPDIMLKISNFVLQTWIIKGMTDLVARGSDINAAYAPSLILLIFASLFFITGVNFMKLQKR